VITLVIVAILLLVLIIYLAIKNLFPKDNTVHHEKEPIPLKIIAVKNIVKVNSAPPQEDEVYQQEV
jgi:hypothetical protein